MKDKELRDKVDGLADDVDNLEQRTNELSMCHIRHCPVCKHDTMQQKRNAFYLDVGAPRTPYDWMCLNCGSELACSTVCQPINTVKKPKGKRAKK